MTKKQLIEAYRAKAGTAVASSREAQEQMERVFEVIGEALHREGTLRWEGFGTWKISQRPAYKGRNPLTGETIKIKARKMVAFKAASALRERVQKAPKKAKKAA